jgi:hypothetical protein
MKKKPRAENDEIHPKITTIEQLVWQTKSEHQSTQLRQCNIKKQTDKWRI